MNRVQYQKRIDGSDWSDIKEHEARKLIRDTYTKQVRLIAASLKAGQWVRIEGAFIRTVFISS